MQDPQQDTILSIGSRNMTQKQHMDPMAEAEELS